MPDEAEPVARADLGGPVFAAAPILMALAARQQFAVSSNFVGCLHARGSFLHNSQRLAVYERQEEG